MSDASRPRFVWYMSGSGGPGSVWHVLDTAAPDAQPGQAIVFASCYSQEAAVMTCLSLNGGESQ